MAKIRDGWEEKLQYDDMSEYAGRDQDESSPAFLCLFLQDSQTGNLLLYMLFLTVFLKCIMIVQSRVSSTEAYSFHPHLPFCIYKIVWQDFFHYP